MWDHRRENNRNHTPCSTHVGVQVVRSDVPLPTREAAGSWTKWIATGACRTWGLSSFTAIRALGNPANCCFYSASTTACRKAQVKRGSNKRQGPPEGARQSRPAWWARPSRRADHTVPAATPYEVEDGLLVPAGTEDGRLHRRHVWEESGQDSRPRDRGGRIEPPLKGSIKPLRIESRCRTNGNGTSRRAERGGHRERGLPHGPDLKSQLSALSVIGIATEETCCRGVPCSSDGRVRRRHR